MHREGTIESALVERAFTYDVMLHTAFERRGVLGGGGWTADSMTRYHPTVLKGTLLPSHPLPPFTPDLPSHSQVPPHRPQGDAAHLRGPAVEALPQGARRRPPAVPLPRRHAGPCVMHTWHTADQALPLVLHRDLDTR